MKAARCLAIAITICSWLALSNHCAICALSTKTPIAQSGCPFHSKPAKPQPQPAGAECCKVLRAVTATPAKNFAPAIVDLVQADPSFTELVVFAPPKISFTPATLDTGPPGKTSFVELIGSVRAHAPPFSA